jgi:excinuclease UvrABC ATPase subunit
MSYPEKENTINLETVNTGKKCAKCSGEIVIRNSHRFPYDLVIECKNCKKRYKVEPT